MSRRITIVTLLGTLIAFGQAAQVQAQTRKVNIREYKLPQEGVVKFNKMAKYSLTPADITNLENTVVRFDRAIRGRSIPSFELYIPQGSSAKWNTMARRGAHIEVTNLGSPGELAVFGTFGVSGHLLDRGTSITQLEQMGKTDSILLSLKPAGAPTWKTPQRILRVKSTDLATQAPVILKLKEGANTVFYSRVGAGGRGGIVRGSEPSLRQIVFHWNGK